MAIYTNHDMIRDCRDNRAEGWRYLATHYTPVIRYFLTHYYGSASAVGHVLAKLKDPHAPLYAAPGAGTEREFVAALKKAVVAIVEADKPSPSASLPLDLDTLAAALGPLTATEKQMVWLESMAYPPDLAAKMLNLEPSTIEKARARANELLRANMDQWKLGLMRENGLALASLASAAAGQDCLPVKAYLDTIDGRITWDRKQDCELHVARCWHCVDAFSRIREADYALRVTKPLTEEEAAPLFGALSVAAEQKKPRWKLWGSA